MRLFPKLIQGSTLAVVGTVEEMNYVYRPEIRCKITTDIVVKIDNLIKGKPNAGHRYVDFMIRGGKGKHGGLRISTQPKFQLGEKVYAVFDE